MIVREADSGKDLAESIRIHEPPLEVSGAVGSNHWLVAEDDGRIIGFAVLTSLTLVGAACHGVLMVLKTLPLGGYSQAAAEQELFRASLQWFAAQGCTTVYAPALNYPPGHWLLAVACGPDEASPVIRLGLSQVQAFLAAG